MSTDQTSAFLVYVRFERIATCAGMRQFACTWHLPGAVADMHTYKQQIHMHMHMHIASGAVAADGPKLSLRIRWDTVACSTHMHIHTHTHMRMRMCITPRLPSNVHNHSLHHWHIIAYESQLAIVE